jgi:hypothetical protein
MDTRLHATNQHAYQLQTANPDPRSSAERSQQICVFQAYHNTAWHLQPSMSDAIAEIMVVMRISSDSARAALESAKLEHMATKKVANGAHHSTQPKAEN